MVNLLVAAALASAMPAAPQPTVHQGPALFVVRDASTTVYIFGTFHALDANSQSFGDKIREAFEQSDELVLETLIPEQPSKLPQSSTASAPLPITPSASFLATTRMAIRAGRALGMHVDNGADVVLRHTAESEGKRVEGLETLQLQITMFNHIPSPPEPSAQDGQRPANIVQVDALAKAMAEMQSAWKRGD